MNPTQQIVAMLEDLLANLKALRKLLEGAAPLALLPTECNAMAAKAGLAFPSACLRCGYGPCLMAGENFRARNAPKVEDDGA